MATPVADLRELRADCARCVGLCCVALPLTRSADFPVDKAPGEPCRHLDADDRCGIHARLRDAGFRGCVVYDCLGAGQQVSQVTFAGRSWRDDAATARAMFDAFAVMRQLHELLWFLSEAQTLRAAATLDADLAAALVRVRAITGADAGTVRQVDLVALHRDVDPLLQRVSAAVRRSASGPRQDLRRADLVGKDLRSADLRGADLRGALLIAADLRDADLRAADLIGADLRDADLRGADLSTALFLTPPQLAAARGDRATRAPARVGRPAHWAG